MALNLWLMNLIAAIRDLLAADEGGEATPDFYRAKEAVQKAIDSPMHGGKNG